MMLTERNRQKLRGYITTHMLPVAQGIAYPKIVRCEHRELVDLNEIVFVHWAPYKGSVGVGRGSVYLKFNKQIIKDYFNYYRRSVVRQTFLEFNVAQDLLNILSETILTYGYKLFEVGEKTLYSYLLYGVNGVKRGQFFIKALHRRLLPYVGEPVSLILEEDIMDSLLHSIQGMGLINEHTLNFRRKLKVYVLAHQNEQGLLQLEETNDASISLDLNTCQNTLKHLRS